MYSPKDLVEEVDLFNKRIGRNVGELRRELKLRQKDLSQRAQLLGFGYSECTFSRIETGAKKITVFDLIVLAQVMNVSVDRILTGGENENATGSDSL